MATKSILRDWQTAQKLICAAMASAVLAGPEGADAKPFAYMTGRGGSFPDGTYWQVGVLDQASNTLTAKISLNTASRATQTSGIAITPDGSHAYVANDGVGTVSAIDTATNMLVATIPVSASAGLGDIAISQDGKYAYVTTTYSDYKSVDAVDVIDTTSNTQIASVDISSYGWSPRKIVTSPDGKYAYVGAHMKYCSWWNNCPAIVIIDATTNTVADVINQVDFRHTVDLAVSPDGAYLYLSTVSMSGAAGSRITVYDTVTHALVANIPVNFDFPVMAPLPNGKSIYVSGHYFDNSNKTPFLQIIDTATNAIAGSILLEGVNTSVSAIAATPDSKHIFVSKSDGNTSIIDTATNRVTSTFTGTFSDIAFTPIGSIQTAPKNLGACSCPNAPLEGNPINAGTGNKFQAETDYVGAPHTGLELTRTYNSLATEATTFGANWRSSYHRKIVLQNPNTALVFHADGRIDTFRRTASYLPWQAEADVTSRLLDAKNSSGQRVGWYLINADDSTDAYALDGRLFYLTTRAGLTTSLSYDDQQRLSKVTGPFGQTLIFEYDAQNRINQVTAPDGGLYLYGYDAANNLTSVTYPGGKTRQYLYEDTTYAHALTGILDEKGQRFATYAYDAQGRAIATEHAGGAEKIRVDYTADGTAKITDARGATHTYSFTTQFEVVKPATVTGATSAAKATTYDANGFIASRTDRRGVTTTYIHNTRGLETSRTEAVGTAQERTITTEWHPNFRLPTKITAPGRVTDLLYDTQGNLKEKTVTAGTDKRTWTYQYNARGQVTQIDGPRTDVRDITTLTYDPLTGVMTSLTDALGHVTQFTLYDKNGRLREMQDPNGLLIKFGYDLRGRLTSRTEGTEVTRFGYDAASNLIKVTQPDGAYLLYGYDAAHRLTSLKDALGNRIVYTRDKMGNVTKTQIFDPANVLTQRQSAVYDSLNRLTKSLGAEGQTTLYGYDANSNLTKITDPLSQITSQSFDALNRLVKVIDSAQGVTTTAYDALDHVTTITDPRRLATTYSPNGLGDQTALQSPDSGTTTRSFDAAGNVLTSIDARGKKTIYAYDALNRPTKVTFADGTTLTNIYDTGTYGIGHLSKVIDPSGTTTFTYDQHGRPTAKSQTASDGTSLTLGQSYDAVGRLAELTYPSGMKVSYGRDPMGRITQVNINGAAFLSTIQYQPFGPIKSWWEGSTFKARTFDLDGRLTSFPLGADTRSVTYDTARHIKNLTDAVSGLTQTLDYDALDRLTASTSGSVTRTYGYDGNGNRTLLTTAAGSFSMTIAPTSNRLTQQTTPTGSITYSHDAAGNMTGNGTRRFGFNARGRLASATVGGVTTTYAINGLGERVKKSGAGETRFLYGGGMAEDGTALLGEYTPTGASVQETIWLDGAPVGVRTLGQTFRIYADHLNTPRVITTAAGQTVWNWTAADPFGASQPSGSLTYNLRFPGQYYDSETGLNYNMARSYHAGLGRYLESDPLGLAGGINTYAYVKGNPVNAVDPRGEQTAELLPFIGVASMVCVASTIYHQSKPQVTQVTIPEPSRSRCTPDQEKRYGERVHNICDAAKACKEGNSPEELINKIGDHSNCIDARQLVQDVCYPDSPDITHQQAIDERISSIKNCQKLLQKLGR